MAAHRTRTLIAALLVLALGAASAHAAPLAPVPVTFAYLPLPTEKVASVTLRGDFNNWGETPMAKQPDGSFTVTVLLVPGRHAYKFFINGQWPRDMGTARAGGPIDPAADGYVDDGYNGMNAYRDVAPAPAAAVRLGDGAVYAPGLAFRPADPAYVVASNGGSVELRVRTAPSDVERVTLEWRTNPAGAWRSVEMRRIGETVDSWVYAATIAGPDGAPGSASSTALPGSEGAALPAASPQAARPLEVRFALRDGGPALYFGSGGVGPDAGAAAPFTVSLPVRGPALVPWAPGTTAYQIFPDRFRDGDRSNDPPGASPWGAPIGPDTSSQYYGGDLRGIIDELPYLHELGVGLLYLNPIFEAGSSHRYDTTDYLKIDPKLGTLSDFQELIRAAHALGIKVILDGVFNHTGTGFWAFQDILRNGKGSRYADWYFIKSYPVSIESGNYVGWDGLSSLPKLNVANPDVTRYLLSVVRFWTEQGIDGWRFDVPNEIQAPSFWSEVRSTVKSIDPNAYLVGEIWQVDPAWLQGDRFDALMNYPIGYQALLPFFARQGGWNATRVADSVQTALFAYSPAVDQMSFNLIDSHDTPRALTILGGGDVGATPSPLAIRRLEAAIALQFTLPGIPVIYYGDERGMTGDRRASWDAQRATVDWERVIVPELLDRYRLLIRLRAEHPALSSAAFTSLLADDANGVWAYERTADAAAAAIEGAPAAGGVLGAAGGATGASGSASSPREQILVVTTNADGPVSVTLPAAAASDAGVAGGPAGGTAIVPGARYEDLLTGERFTASDAGLAISLDGPSTRILLRR